MTNPKAADEPCTIVVADLFALITARRKLLQLSPIEGRAMASRCTLRFNLDRQRGVDFSAEKIVIDPDDMLVLQKMVNDQFGVDFDGELNKLCVKPKKPVMENTRAAPPPQTFAPAAPIEPQRKAGLGSWIKRLFGGA